MSALLDLVHHDIHSYQPDHTSTLCQIWYIMDRYQTRQMEKKDVRVNLVNEILNGIKVQL